MVEPLRLGRIGWSYDEMRQALPLFAILYESRPIRDNQGGMRAPHMFALWFFLRHFQPESIIESGVWKGQGTWLIEQACPKARIFSIDPALENRRYISRRGRYFKKDFARLRWHELNPEKTLVFFDDHQNALERIRQCRRLGFRRMIFEDNYPPGRGDCYSLKQAWANLPEPVGKKRGFWQAMIHSLRPDYGNSVPPERPREFLRKELATYFEVPPVCLLGATRWGTPWSEVSFSTPEPLYPPDHPDLPRIFRDESSYYTWMCLVELA